VPPMQVSKSFGSLKVWPPPENENGSLLVSELQTSAWPISCCIRTPPSSAAHGTWFCCLAVLYSACQVNGVPEQSAMLVSVKPFDALAVMNPVRWVVRSLTVVVNPFAGSVMETWSLSPGLIISVLPFGVNVLTSVCCGFGGPAGTPLVCR